jgi:hypothetical protein
VLEAYKAYVRAHRPVVRPSPPYDNPWDDPGIRSKGRGPRRWMFPEGLPQVADKAHQPSVLDGADQEVPRALRECQCSGSCQYSCY